MKRLPQITLTLLVAALVAIVLCMSSCRSIGRASKSTAGGSAIAVVLLFTPAPWLAIPVAALTGHIGGTIQAGDDIQEEATKAAEKAVVKYVDREVVKFRDREVVKWREYIPAWLWWSVFGYLAFRFRHGLAALFASLTTGGVKAALLTLAGILWGGPVADKAKEAVSKHEESSPRALALRRLRRVQPAPRTPPAVVVSQEQKPHA